MSSSTKEEEKPKTKNSEPRTAVDGTEYPADFDLWYEHKRVYWIHTHNPHVCQWGGSKHEPPATQTLESNGIDYPVCQECYDREMGLIAARKVAATSVP
jgi:hypothetical protein